MTPVLQALVLAEHVYEDKSGKKIIAGTFNQVLFHKGPPVLAKQTQPDGTEVSLVQGGMEGGSPFAYVSITDICGEVSLDFQFVFLDNNTTLFETTVVVECSNRLKTVEIVAPLPKLPIRESGTYAFEVLSEGEILGSHRVLAREFKIKED